MNDGTYQEGEKHQESHIIVRCKIKHSPGNEAHLQQLCMNYFPVKGVPIFIEDGKLIIEI